MEAMHFRRMESSISPRQPDGWQKAVDFLNAAILPRWPFAPIIAIGGGQTILGSGVPGSGCAPTYRWWPAPAAAERLAPAVPPELPVRHVDPGTMTDLAVNLTGGWIATPDRNPG